MDIHRDWFDSRQVSGACVDMKFGKPHRRLWLPEFYVHIPYQMST